MRREDIYNGVTDIRDDLIERAEVKRRAPKYWRRALAAVLAVCVALGGFAALRLVGVGGSSGSDTPGSPPQDSEPTVKPGTDTPSVPGSASGGAEDPGMTGSGEPAPGGGVTGSAAQLLEPLVPVTAPAGGERLDGDIRDAMADFLTSTVPELLRSGDGENTAASPVNLYMSLSVLAEASGGETRQQLLDLMGSGAAGEARDRAEGVLNGLFHSGDYTLSLENSLWLPDNAGFVPETVDILAESLGTWVYRGEMGGEAVYYTLQSWLNRGTRGPLVKTSLGTQPWEGTSLALASTAYFADRWLEEFDPDSTAAGDFHSPSGDVTAEFMRGSINGRVSKGQGFTALTLPLASGGSVRLILPDEGVSAENLTYSGEAMSYLTLPETEAEEAVIDLALPKFDVSGGSDLAQTLKSLGVTGVFDPELADLSPIVTGDTRAYVSRMLQACRLRVDEGGVEAADLAGAEKPKSEYPAPPEMEVDITFDRPFLFSVMSQCVPVFAGCVNEPKY